MAASLRHSAGTCAVDGGALARATAVGTSLLEHARRTRQPFLELEAAYVLASADPITNRHLVTTVLDQAAESRSWLDNLQVERCRIMLLLIDADYTTAMIRAADSIVIADALPHRWEAIEARLLLGDASLGAREQRQAMVAYDEALTAAVRHGSTLRAADALDGYAAALRQVRHCARLRRLDNRASRAAPPPRSSPAPPVAHRPPATPYPDPRRLARQRARH